MAARFLEPCGTEQRVGTERTVERGGLRIRIEGGRRVLGALARMRQPIEGLLAEIPGGRTRREVLAVHRGRTRRIALTGQSVSTVQIGEPSGRGPRIALGDGLEGRRGVGEATRGERRLGGAEALGRPVDLARPVLRDAEHDGRDDENAERDPSRQLPMAADPGGGPVRQRMELVGPTEHLPSNLDPPGVFGHARANRPTSCT